MQSNPGRLALAWLAVWLLSGSALQGRSDTRPAAVIAGELEAALDSKDHATALRGAQELAQRRDQWGTFVLGQFYMCAKIVEFDCGRAQALFLVSENPAAKLDPEIVRLSRNEIAWINAACDQPGFVRDPDLALRLAIEAAKDPSDPYALDTLAAAHANKGDYAQAIRLQQEAVGKLDALAHSEPVRAQARHAFRLRLALYRESKPARFDASTVERECNFFD